MNFISVQTLKPLKLFPNCNLQKCKNLNYCIWTNTHHKSISGKAELLKETRIYRNAKHPKTLKTHKNNGSALFISII